MNYDKTKYRKIDWKHFMMFHWIINPGLMINELIFGQRVPMVMLMERNTKKAWAERFKVPCPHCNNIHDNRTWNLTNKTMFKNWFGLYCPACSGVIPCLMNIGTFVVLAVSSPIWYWFRKPLYKKMAGETTRALQKPGPGNLRFPKTYLVATGAWLGHVHVCGNHIIRQNME